MDETPSEIVKGWTIETIHVHFAALRATDERFYNERDRRYTEVDLERERAAALAREYQTSKDAQANELRTQLAQERHGYATRADLEGMEGKIEAKLDPIVAWVQAQQGRQAGIGVSAGVLVAALTVMGGLIGTVVVVANLLTGG